jgi:hypothetical protein
MFSSGAVKLLSRGKEWWSMDALIYHYETTCIPHIGSYLAFKMPIWLHIASCVAMFIIELLLPWFMFTPTRMLRHINAFGQISLQIMIMATGNYNFFNFLTIVLACSLIDDSFWNILFSIKIGIEKNNNKKFV